MHIFYSNLYDGNIFTLDEAESIHLSRVLRLKTGDAAMLINGSGSLFNCRVIETGKKLAKLEVVSVVENYNKRDYYLHVAIAPTKSIDRFEWFIEKSVEIGIDKITPLICERSERRITKTQRSRRIIISAMKQSLKASDTIISEAVSFDKVINSCTEANRFIAHCNDMSIQEKPKALIRPGSDNLVLIGPEGDFTIEEVNKAVDKGFQELNLGPSRLRTETAGIVACSMYYFNNL
jgi:16S rRNA (uracil1498-N3)-methyltransferase